MDLFRVAIRHVDGGVVVELIGDLDLCGAPHLNGMLRPFRHRYDRGQITFDCSRLSFVDSAGLLAIFESLRPFFGEGHPTLRHLNRQGRRVLEAIGLIDAFDVSADQAARADEGSVDDLTEPVQVLPARSA